MTEIVLEKGLFAAFPDLVGQLRLCVLGLFTGSSECRSTGDV